MSSPIFNGTSRYSQDFQQVINRAVQIASLPITQLNQQKLALTDQQTAIKSLQTQFSALGTALSNLSNAVTSGSVSAQVSNTGVAAATITGNVLPGSVDLQVTSIGSFTSTLSGAGNPVVADPTTGGISNSASYSLTVDGKVYSLSPSGTSLNSLVAAINASGANVQANIVNLGAPGSPDYRLAVQSTNLGAVAIDLSDGQSSLLNTLSTGAPAVYTVNGQPSGGITSSSRTIALAPGLTVDLKSTGTTTIAVNQSPSLLGDSLKAFVTAFNSSVDEVDKHRGQAGGALSGDAILSPLSQALSQLGNYASGSFTLNDVGISFDSTGHLQFNASVLQNISPDQFSKLSGFLGDIKSGGFLKAASDSLSTLNDASSGLFRSSLDSLSSSIKNSDDLIAANQLRVSDLQTSLQQKMSAADALIAQLEQQVTYFNALFQSGQSSK